MDIEPLDFMIVVWDYLRKRKQREVEDNMLDRRYERILIYYYRDHPEEIEDDD
ncbi:MAG: hypothetical protein HDQ97_02750 [Lachnospiraceae bacterium]|nr:hypothetical protein [Lachnospiraceae bacterium]